MPGANDRIGPYQLIRKLGKGAFGEVWLAKNVKVLAAREVALKIPLDEEIDLDAIRHEAAIWIAASGHTNVLPIIEADVYSDYVVIASEYAPDGSLEQWLKRHGGRAPSIAEAVEMTRGILAGLEHLHARRIIHRDLKPANILLQGATPRIADFGISRVFKSTSHSQMSAGTPVYMAPEAFQRKRNEQTDLWSVGVILYQILAGRLPFTGQDIAEVMGAIMNEEPPSLPNSVPASLRQVVAKALKKKPAERYQSAAEMCAALTLRHNEEETQPRPILPKPLPLQRPKPRLSRARNWLIATAIGLAVVAVYYHVMEFTYDIGRLDSIFAPFPVGTFIYLFISGLIISSISKLTLSDRYPGGFIVTLIIAMLGGVIGKSITRVLRIQDYYQLLWALGEIIALVLYHVALRYRTKR
jgi:serine/threonine protein kinase